MSGPLDRSQDPDRYDPERDAALPPAGVPLDMSQDPDRFDAVRDVGLVPVERPAVPRLDPDADPDRFRPRRTSDPTLADLLGESAGDDDEPRDTYTWLVGLVGMLVFLGLVALLFGQVLTPRG